MSLKSKEIVFQSFLEMIKEEGLDIVSTEDMDISRETGFDSLGLVTFVLILEEKLGIDLDNYLGKIRECKKLQDVIDLVDELEMS